MVWRQLAPPNHGRALLLMAGGVPVARRSEITAHAQTRELFGVGNQLKGNFVFFGDLVVRFAILVSFVLGPRG